MKNILPLRTKYGIRLIVANILIFFLLLIFTEGVTSYLLIFHDVLRLLPISEKQHTKYDPDLGWVNIPNIYIPNMFGPGVYLKTNGQGFRNNQDFSSIMPTKKIRIICSGDSFTLGFGVDNDNTWCQKLSSIEPSFETINMGQGGYGVDQAFLWFKRDATKLKHHVHLFSFITHDFYRMQYYKFSGYGKPVIKIEDSKIVVRNVPVPASTFRFSWFTSRINHLINELNTVKFFNSIVKKSGLTAKQSQTDKNEETREVLLNIFKELKHINKEKSSTLILVYLPVKSEIISDDQEEWHKFIEKASRSLNIPLIDVAKEFQLLDAKTALSLFIPEGQIPYIGAAGHLNNKGNEMVAQLIYEKLKNNVHLSHALSLEQ